MSGFERLKEIADGSLEPVYNVYQVVYDPEILKAGYYSLKSNPKLGPNLNFDCQ